MREPGRFLSCDWGTSSFRLKLVSTELETLAEVSTDNGILRSFELWKQKKLPEENRVSFYCNLIDHQIKRIEQQQAISLDNVPLIISGMASSNIGMLELPYKMLPFWTDGSDLQFQNIKATDQFEHDVLLISGVCTDNDVMRGEETILVGCDDDSPNGRVYILPGTHSKHVFIMNGVAIACKTYMTGEFFELLSKKSILSESLVAGDDLFSANNLQSFEKGIRLGIDLNLLNSSFLARTNILFDKLTKQENYYFLSGILIGTELKELINPNVENVCVVGNASQLIYYEEAFKQLNKMSGIIMPLQIDADKAIVKGQLKIMLSRIRKSN